MPAAHHTVSTGRMPFLPPNEQRQSTEGTFIHIHPTHLRIHVYPFIMFSAGQQRAAGEHLAAQGVLVQFHGRLRGVRWAAVERAP